MRVICFFLKKLFGYVLVLYVEAVAFVFWDDWYRNPFSPLHADIFSLKDNFLSLGKKENIEI